MKRSLLLRSSDQLSRQSTKDTLGAVAHPFVSGSETLPFRFRETPGSGVAQDEFSLGMELLTRSRCCERLTL